MHFMLNMLICWHKGMFFPMFLIHARFSAHLAGWHLLSQLASLQGENNHWTNAARYTHSTNNTFLGENPRHVKSLHGAICSHSKNAWLHNSEGFLGSQVEPYATEQSRPFILNVRSELAELRLSQTLVQIMERTLRQLSHILWTCWVPRLIQK